MRTIFYIFDYKTLFDIAGISRLLHGERLQDKMSDNVETQICQAHVVQHRADAV